MHQQSISRTFQDPATGLTPYPIAAMRWKILHGEDPLGVGHFAKVYRCLDQKTDKLYAVKVIDQKDIRRTWPNVHAEIKILSCIGEHRHIVSLIDTFADSSHYFIVMELCQGGDLFSRIVDVDRYSERDAANICRQIAEALQFIHSRGITHRDLKPENILLVDTSPKSDIKIADFGLSKLTPNGQGVMKTVCGTWAYCAPEVIKHEQYTSKVDNWTLGVLMYILLCGFHPFDVYGNASEQRLVQAIVSCKFDFEDPAWTSISQEAKSLITQLLRVGPDERLTLDNFLASPWIQGYASEKQIHNLAPRLSSLQYLKEKQKREGTD